MRAIVDINGKQYQVEEGRYVQIDSFDADVETPVTLDKVCMIMNGENSLVGAPYVEGATIQATVRRHARGPKIIVYKMRCKKGYRRKNGHRQGFTELQIVSLNFPGKPAEAKTAAPKAAPAPEAAAE